FFQFLKEQRDNADTLYILGDLFDAWIGDDTPLPAVKEIFAVLKAATDSGLSIHVMHGNRDFLLGHQFELETGCRLIDDPTLITLDGKVTLLTHGDLLCTDDIEYQQARTLLRSTPFIDDFLSKTIPERIDLAAEYRKKSGEVISLKSADIMDVNLQAVEQALLQHGASQLIHGHTHRPDQHQFELDGKTVTRFVLHNWSETSGGYLVANNNQLSVQCIHSE
ncbi:MAG: UDP-2,3-diacylglucosamine diphosphatase, partial [Gammaproteobacteria bacterium]|nr:UDP-2,3-diacylglucosamine diphosphatase [Gammaproteobacteria bacterium]